MQRMPRGRSPWTKELDLKFVQAIKDELGASEDVVKHSETILPWEKTFARLRDTWPEGIDSIKALKRRWDNAFRVWYAKAGLLDLQDDDGKSSMRATIISLSKLYEMLEKRDYVLESRPGRRKSMTPSRKRKNDIEEEDESDDEKGKAEEEAGATEESDSSSSHQVAPQKKIRAEPTDPRLRPWLVFLETPELAKSFRIQSHSGIVIEPKVILDGILGNGNNVSASDIVSLVKTIAPSEWFNRICNITDTQSIRKLLTQKMSFFLFPSKEVSLDGQRFMFTFVSYPASVNQEPQKPCMWSFLQDMNQGQSSNAMTEMLKSLDVTNLFPREEFKSVDIALKAKLPFALLSLASFQECLRQSTSPVLNQATFSFDDQVKNKLLAAILYPPYVTIHSAPYVEPLPLPFKSMYDAVDSLPGIHVPPWCKDIAADKRTSQVDALFAAFKVKLLIADLRKKEQHIIHKRNPSEIEVALLVENKDHFGVVFRIKKTSENQALLSILAPTSSLQDLKINNHSVALDNVNHQVDLNGPVRIDLTLADDVKISLTY